MKLTPEQKALITYVNAVQNWKKRAACRAWIPSRQRGCSTCRHDGTHYKLCALCHGEGWPISWEPKKKQTI